AVLLAAGLARCAFQQFVRRAVNSVVGGERRGEHEPRRENRAQPQLQRPGPSARSVKYSVSSCLVLRHVKYVYDCENPNLARACMSLGRVNASARKITSGWSRLTP